MRNSDYFSAYYKMMTKWGSMKKKLHDFIYLVILVALIPITFYFEICTVLPAFYEKWTIPYVLHLFLATYCLFNVVGNLIYGACTDTSLRGRLIILKSEDPSWSLCTVCECLRPPRAWHCDTCDICILKRDHHCLFFGSCVGYFNHRYFMLFCLHVCVSMLYAFYYNIQYISQILTFNFLTVFKLIFPLANMAVTFDMVESFYLVVIDLNVLVGAFTGFLFVYHLRNILKGKTVPEMKHCTKDFKYDKGWRLNIIEVFGSRWYLTWLLPFIKSPLPGDGIEWTVENKRN